MSDYTPTTEEVRNTFWLGQHSVSDSDWANSEADFNKWLTEVKAQVWEEGVLTEWTGFARENDILSANPYRQGETE